MPFGQSYLAYQFTRRAVEKIAGALGMGEEEAKSLGSVAGIKAGLFVAVTTLDAAGGTATVVDAVATAAASPDLTI